MAASVIICASQPILLSQSAPQVRVETASYSVEQGLSDRDVWNITQDRQGYFWVLTAQGLNRFDGYGFQYFEVQGMGRQPNSSESFVTDREGNLIFPSRLLAKIFRLDPLTGVFSQLPFHDSIGFKGTYMSNFQGVDAEVYFLGVAGKSIVVHRFEEKIGRFFQLFELPVLTEPKVVYPINFIRASDGSFWLFYLNAGRQEKVLHCDASGHLLHTFSTQSFYPQAPASQGYILESPDGHIWIAKRGGTYIWDSLNPQVLRLHPQLAGENYRFNRDLSGNLLAAQLTYYTPNPRVILFTKDGRQFDYSWLYREKVEIGDIRIKPQNTPAFNDFTSGFMAWGTGNGFRKIRLYPTSFSHYLDRPPTSKLPGISARGIAKIGADKLIIVTEFNGVFLLDLRTDSLTDLFKEVRLLPAEPNFSLGRNVLVQGDSVVWIPDHLGLWKYKPSQKSALRIPIGLGLTNAAFDTKGRIWVASSSQEVMSSLDPASNTVRPYKNKDGSNPVEGSSPSYVLAGHDGSIWVGTTLKCLVKIDPEKGESQTFGPEAGFKSNNVSCVYEDWSGLLWVGTLNGGLHVFDPRQGKVVARYTREDGMPHNSVAGIQPDGKGNYWISTYNGLSCFNVAQKTFRNFYSFDGLSHNEFNRYSFFYDTLDGRFYFGGMNGVNAFYEKDLPAYKNEARLLIPEISYSGGGDSLIVQRFGVLDGYQITLPAANRMLNLHLALAHYDNPSGNQFAYILEGLDKNWNYLGTNRDLRFNHLPAGTYTLRIRGADNQGNWSSQEIALHIVVLEFWYKRWWAWLVYALLLGTGGFAYYRFRLQQQLAEREARRLQELDTFKSRFFTNITHEFRTPLTVILGNSEIMEAEIERREKEKNDQGIQFFKPKISLVRRSGENLLRLINEILDLAKLENSSLTINYIHGNVLPYLRYIAESMHSLANARNVMLRVESVEASVFMDYDQERLLQIVHNLLSNAIKFTPSGGKVTLTAKITSQPSATEKQLLLSVSDTGVGIPPEDLPKLFDRFFQAKNQQENKSGGTGIGLSLTRELVKAMQGTISVESTPGAGTTFAVTLPIRNAAYRMRGVEYEAGNADYVVSNAAQSIDRLPRDGKEEFDAQPESKSASNSLLLIEDNPDVVEYLSNCLQDTYQLDFAYNGRAGIERAFENTPDLIISDVMMPEKDGFEVCDVLKNDERTSHVPIILLTARVDVASRIAGLRRGADVYLPKPFHREELLAQIKNLLWLRQKLQQHYASMMLNAQEQMHQEMERPTDPEDAFVLKLRALIEAHITDPKLSPDFIGQKMGMSRTNLHRKLTALTNLPITLFVRSLRLQKARQLLQTTDMNVSEVSFAVGFDDPKYFSRVFSEEFGMPPSAVRRLT